MVLTVWYFHLTFRSDTPKFELVDRTHGTLFWVCELIWQRTWYRHKYAVQGTSLCRHVKWKDNHTNGLGIWCLFCYWYISLYGNIAQCFWKGTAVLSFQTWQNCSQFWIQEIWPQVLLWFHHAHHCNPLSLGFFSGNDRISINMDLKVQIIFFPMISNILSGLIEYFIA